MYFLFDYLFDQVIYDGTYPRIEFTNATSPGGLNEAYDGGVFSAELLDGNGVLDVNEELVIRIRVEIDASSPMISDTLYNLATVAGNYTDPDSGEEMTVEDYSDSGSDYESDNPDAPGNDIDDNPNTPNVNDPTPIPLLGKIAGKVWEDMDGDGIREINEPLEECVLVQLYDEFGFYLNSTFTDSNGCYLFDNLLPGNFKVKFNDFCNELDAEWTFINEGNDDTVDSDVYANGFSESVNVMPAKTTEVDAGYFVCIPIGDLAWYDANQNDLWDWNENGINGLKVTAYRKANNSNEFIEWAQTYTGQEPGTPLNNGWWELCVAPGEYYVQFGTSLNGLVASQPNKGIYEEIDNDIDDFNGNNTTEILIFYSRDNNQNIDAGFYQMASAGDLAWYDANQNGIREDFEKPVPGVLVEVFNDEGQKVSESVSDENGNYFIDYLQQENYYFKVNIPDGFDLTIPNIGSDEKDSDVDGSNGPYTTAFYSMVSGEYLNHIDIGFVRSSVIPVEFIAFSGENRGEFNFLQWSTASEVGNSHFEVERRLNDGEFVTVGRVEGNGSTNEVHTYYFEDWDIEASGNYYYRLKQIDFNDNFEYSGIVAIKVIREGELSKIAIYPNPALSFFQVDVTTFIPDSKIELRLYDIAGKLIKDEVLNKTQSAGHKVYQVDVTDLPEGVYNVKVFTNGDIFDKKIIKVKD